MALTKEQAENIKQQLLAQVDNLPQENKEEIRQQISQFNEEQLEAFLEQNKVQFQGQEQTGKSDSGECIFCSIIQEKTPSYKIAENKKAIAILEINPMTKGHSIILPLEHTTIDKLPKLSMSLAQKIAKKIKTKLKPEDIKIETSSFQGHAIINVVPFYKDQPPKKQKAEEKELEKLQSILGTKKRAPRMTLTTKSKSSKLPKISFRIP
jgi:histidine triad (HIT) family protein